MSLNNDTSVQLLYNKLETTIVESVVQAKQIKNTNQKNCFQLSNETKAMITRRHNLHMKKPLDKHEKVELRNLYKQINKKIKEEHKLYRINIYKECLITHKSIKRGHKRLTTSKEWIPRLKGKDGSSEKRQDIIQIATDYYKQLYEKNQPDQQVLDVETYPKKSGLITPFTLKEVVLAIRDLKNEKSPGPDDIINEALKIGETVLAGAFCKLFNMILLSTETPSQWSQSDIILIYKKGDPSNISNYRPISLMPSTYKLFSKCILKRISKTIDQCQPIEQAGFRSGYSTIDHIHVVSILIERYKEYNTPLYIAFVDYKKAFDSLSHDAIWAALEHHGIDNTYIKILKNIYKNCQSKVRLEKSGPSFSIDRGVRQGDPLSPKLFIAVLELVMRKVLVHWQTKGVKINQNRLTHLRFADDIVLFAKSAKDLEWMIQTLHNESKKVGLLMNLDKTKLLTNHTKQAVQVDSNTIEYVEEYLYLGKMVSFREVDKEEINRRIQIAWRKFWSLKEVLKGNLPMQLKKTVMDTCILPSLTYGCQAWTITQESAKKLATCQRSMERSILRIRLKDKIRNVEIRDKTKITDVLHHITKMKWKWAGHVARIDDDRWTRRVTVWRGPEGGQRKKGRPHKRWADDIVAVAGKEWLTKARDREAWHSLEEAYTRKGA